MVEDIHGTQTIKEVFKAESDVGLARPTVVFFLKPIYFNIKLWFQRSGKQEKVKVMRFFTYRKIKYIWYEKDQEWLNPADMDSAAPFNIYQKLTLDVIGLKEQDVIASRKIYNMNALALALTPILVILFKEVLGPFYLFQCFS